MDNKSFIASLFDFSFSSYVTPKFIKFLFILGVILAAIATVIILIMGFMSHIGIGVVLLVFSPIIYFLWVLSVRIYLETIMVMFRLQSDVSEILKNKK